MLPPSEAARVTFSSQLNDVELPLQASTPERSSRLKDLCTNGSCALSRLATPADGKPAGTRAGGPKPTVMKTVRTK